MDQIVKREEMFVVFVHVYSTSHSGVVLKCAGIERGGSCTNAK